MTTGGTLQKTLRFIDSLRSIPCSSRRQANSNHGTKLAAKIILKKRVQTDIVADLLKFVERPSVAENRYADCRRRLDRVDGCRPRVHTGSGARVSDNPEVTTVFTCTECAEKTSYLLYAMDFFSILDLDQVVAISKKANVIKGTLIPHI
jgi:hypothetical protein